LLKAAHCYLDFSRRHRRPPSGDEPDCHPLCGERGERNRGSNAPL
jgi:hypothetical protein